MSFSQAHEGRMRKDRDRGIAGKVEGTGAHGFPRLPGSYTLLPPLASLWLPLLSDTSPYLNFHISILGIPTRSRFSLFILHRASPLVATSAVLEATEAKMKPGGSALCSVHGGNGLGFLAPHPLNPCSSHKHRGCGVSVQKSLRPKSYPMLPSHSHVPV